jgi:hypothetical protein
MMGQGLWREYRSCGELIGGMVRVGSKRLLGGEVVGEGAERSVLAVQAPKGW